MLKTKVALAWNRTPFSRVAGENSTTEPPMHNVTSHTFPMHKHIKNIAFMLKRKVAMVKNKTFVGNQTTGLPRGLR